MQVKLLKIEDDNSGEKVEMRALAIRFIPASDYEHSVLIEHAGFRPDGNSIMLIELDSQRCTDDPYEWPALGVRHPSSLTIAHLMLVRNFDRFPEGEINRINVAHALDAWFQPGDSAGNPYSDTGA